MKKIMGWGVVIAIVGVGLWLTFGMGTHKSSLTLLVYSARKEHLIKPIFDQFTRKSGIAVQYVTDEAGPLIEKLKLEGGSSTADLLLTVDAGNLWYAASQGLLRPVSSRVLEENVPAHLRDTENRWFGLSLRARTIVYNTKAVNPSELSTYEALSDLIWKHRLCLRTSKKVYNQSLVAMMIKELGQSSTEAIVSGWVGNLSRPVFGSDTEVIEAIAAGECDVGIVNTYYLGRLLQEKPTLPVALFWPNQKDRGVHVNVSGAGVLVHSKHVPEATQLLEWMSEPATQKMFADSNLEYPVHPNVEPHELVKKWGTFKPSTTPVSAAGEYQHAAVMLMDRLGYQ